MYAATEFAAPAIQLSGLTQALSADAATKGISTMGVGSMIALAGLDLLGSWCAMRFHHTGHQGWWSAGAACFVLVFVVYCASLHYAELGTVTLGWIVLLQIGVIAMDRVANGTVLPPAKWLAVSGIIALMAYVLLTPNGKAYMPKHAGNPDRSGQPTFVERAPNRSGESGFVERAPNRSSESGFVGRATNR